jgi:uncharacterized membrane protein
VNAYFWLKTVHIISATILFGTGLGTAFFKWVTDRSGDVHAIRIVAERVVWADWIFTTPAVVVQAVTGVMLARTLGFPISSGWVAHASCSMCSRAPAGYPFSGCRSRCATSRAAPLDAKYWRLARIWLWLGVPAFCAVLAIFALMVVKPVL